MSNDPPPKRPMGPIAPAVTGFPEERPSGGFGGPEKVTAVHEVLAEVRGIDKNNRATDAERWRELYAQVRDLSQELRDHKGDARSFRDQTQETLASILNRTTILDQGHKALTSSLDAMPGRLAGDVGRMLEAHGEKVSVQLREAEERGVRRERWAVDAIAALNQRTTVIETTSEAERATRTLQHSGHWDNEAKMAELIAAAVSDATKAAATVQVVRADVQDLQRAKRVGIFWGVGAAMTILGAIAGIAKLAIILAAKGWF